jgi:AbiU2
MNLEQAQREFEQRLQALDDDSRSCAAFAYTEYVLWHVAGYDFDVRRILNDHKEFWWPVLWALQQSAYIALGRMFDDDSRTHNLRHLLKFADEWRGIFSRKALEERKVRDGLDAALAKTYAAHRRHTLSLPLPTRAEHIGGRLTL